MAAPMLVPDVVDQQAFDEVTIEDEDLRLALEARNEKRADAAEARAAYKFANDKVVVEIEKLELPVGGAVRVGRFRISRRFVQARSVSFDAAASDRVTIAVVE